MESNLVAGAQNLVVGEPLVYGQSITDPLYGLGGDSRFIAAIGRRGSDRTLGPGVVPFPS
jgi:3-deoxy-D-arabino-heptulosonate 7-phosphate (DAHP) synthase